MDQQADEATIRQSQADSRLLAPLSEHPDAALELAARLRLLETLLRQIGEGLTQQQHARVAVLLDAYGAARSSFEEFLVACGPSLSAALQREIVQLLPPAGQLQAPGRHPFAGCAEMACLIELVCSISTYRYQ